MGIFQDIRAAFAEPDPLRFANHSIPAPNWFGELEGVAKKKRGLNERVVLVNEATAEFEFPDSSPFDGIDIPKHLTDQDIKGLRAHGLNPENPAYTVAKKYFAGNPGCGKKDLAENSAPPFGKGMAVETAKDVIAIFRENALK